MKTPGDILKELSDVFTKNDLPFWLEAGTALAAAREGRIFDWEHDIDIATWKVADEKILKLVKDLESTGFNAKIQKNMPFIDNIIQLEVPSTNGERPFPDQVDIYLYTEYGEYAYMRWVQKPEGKLAYYRKYLFELFVMFAKGERKFNVAKYIFPTKLRLFLFNIFFRFHLNLSSCIFHRIPKKFFKNLKKIDFYGVQVSIAEETSDYLNYRYGDNWMHPDKNFNQKGKWRKAQARVLLPMSTIPRPKLIMSLRKDAVK